MPEVGADTRAPAIALSWHKEIVRRFCVRTGFKFVALVGFMVVFFAGYFATLNRPIFAVTEMPVTALDRTIAFQPVALVAYLTLWVYVALPALLIEKDAELAKFGAVAAILGAVGLAVFLIWPTVVPRPSIDWAAHPGFGHLKQIDRSGNACPSLHVAYAVFCCFELDRILAEVRSPLMVRFFSFLWCAAIVYSTLATKQHVAVDVYAGGLLGLAAAAGSAKMTRATPATANAVAT